MVSGLTHIIGCGDIGRRVARLHHKANKRVSGWVKSQASLQACQSMEIEAHCLDLDQAVTQNSHIDQCNILYTVPPVSQGIKDNRLVAFLKTIEASQINKFVLISTTGVYGDCAGAMVDETARIKPGVERAFRRADAENVLQDWARKNKVAYVILRVPGIYAPDRLPLKRLTQGMAVVRRSEAPWTNRIHADDLASACYAALHLPVVNEIINVSDDAPGTMTEYFFAVADYAGLPRPPEISLQEARQRLSPGMISYLAESRRISNAKMKSLLKINLRYPTLKQGLMGALKAG